MIKLFVAGILKISCVTSLEICLKYDYNLLRNVKFSQVGERQDCGLGIHQL